MDDQHQVSQPFAEPSRESIWSLIFIAGRLLRRVGLANLAIAAVAVLSGRTPVLLLAVAVVGALVLAILSAATWWRRTFHIEGGDLVVTSGLVAIERITIPLSRIQSVHIEQQFLHRPIGLVWARIETAGSAGSEFQFEAIDRPTAIALRHAVTQAGGAGEGAVPERPVPDTVDAPEPAQVLLRRRVRDLVYVALTRNPLADLALVAPLVVLIQELGDALGVTERELLQLRDTVDLPLVALIGLAVVAYLVVFGGLWFGSTLLRYHDLTLVVEGDRLRSTSGLLSRSERSAAFDRIQLIRERQNPLQRRAAISHVTLPTASSLGSRNDSIVLPGTKPEELVGLRSLLLPPVGGVARPISVLAVQRWITWIGIVPAVAAGLIAWVLVGWRAAAVVLWPLTVALIAPVARRRWRWTLSADTLEVVHGPVVRTRQSLALHKTQAVSLVQTIFHRRHGLATVVIHTAVGDVQLPHLELDRARAVRDRILYRTETELMPWR